MNDKTVLGEITKAKLNLKNYTAAFALVIVVIISALMSETFLLPNNIVNILKQISPTGLMALGMTYVILTGGIDLSVGSVMACAGVIVAMQIPVVGDVSSILMAIAFGAGTGFLYGICITKLNVPPFIATLAGVNVWRGVSLVVTGSAAQPITDQTFNSLGNYKIPPMICYFLIAVFAAYQIYFLILNIKSNRNRVALLLGTAIKVAACIVAFYLVTAVDGLNIQIILFIAIFLIMWFILEKTVFGCQVYAIGGNPESSRMSGIRVDRNLCVVYIISSVCAALCGVLTAARLGAGVPQAGQGGELDAIAAVVIGGTSMSGGSGKITKTIIGIILIGVLNNLLTLLGVSSDMQLIFKGVIVAGAVILDTSTNRK